MLKLFSPKAVIGGFILLIIALFLYSFTQIDLSLTLSQASFFQIVQQAFQYIGYFNRPLSAQIFFFLIIGLFIFYTLILESIKKQRMTQKQVLVTVCIATLLLTVSYNAFSYDLFNYIFDAKIFTAYGENPYLKKALDFPNDPMLSFMRWT